MAQHAGSNGTLDARLGRVALQDFPKALPAHLPAADIGKEHIRAMPLEERFTPVFQICLHGLQRLLIDRIGILVARKMTLEIAYLQIDILYLEADKLLDHDPRRIQKLDHGLVPEQLRRLPAGNSQDLLHVLLGGALRLSALNLRTGQSL